MRPTVNDYAKALLSLLPSALVQCCVLLYDNHQQQLQRVRKIIQSFLLLLPITSFYITDTSCPGQSITLQYFLPSHLTAYQTIVNHSYPLFGSGFRQYVWCLAKRDNTVFEHLFIWFANTISQSIFVYHMCPLASRT